jgi:uncharacterized protein GlcG (DUF336 family)
MIALCLVLRIWTRDSVIAAGAAPESIGVGSFRSAWPFCKAYTSTLSGQDLHACVDRLKSQSHSVAEMGDSNLAAVQGGVVVLHPGTGSIMGGIGVSGLSVQGDEDLARLLPVAANLVHGP